MKKAICISLSFIIIMQVNSVEGDVAKKATQEELNAIYQHVFGKKQETLPIEMKVEFEINNKTNGKIELQTNTKKITQLQRNILLPRLKQYLITKIYTKLEQSDSDNDWLSTETLEGAGITVSYNMMDLTAEINIKRNSMNRRMRSMLSAGRHQVIPENLLEPASVSGYINLGSSMSYRHQAKDNKTKLSLRAAGAINVQGFVLEHQHSFQLGYNSSSRRGYTRLVFDDPENDLRYKVGDISTLSRNLQTHFQLGGLQLSKEMIWSNSSETRPQGDFSFTLNSDSEIEIYQDGKLDKTIHLKAGEYTLSEIKANKGNQIRLRIKDEFGKHYLEIFNRFADSRLLKPDYARYAISVGIPRSRQGNNIHYDVGHKIASAFYQQGITEHFTAGIDAQTDGKAYQLGTDAIWATKIGNISAGLAYTHLVSGQSGQALRFQLNSRKDRGQKQTQKLINWSLSLGRFSKDYHGFSVAKIDGKNTQGIATTKQQLNLSFNHAFSGRLSANLNLSRRDYYQQNATQQLSLGINQRLTKSASLSVYASHSNNGKGKTDNKISFNLNLNFPLGKTASGRYQSISSSYSSQSQSLRSSYRIGSKGRWGQDSLTGSLRLESKQGIQAVSADTRYRDLLFDFNAAHRSSINSRARNVSQTSNANLNTAIAFADGAFSFSRPISNSFAILTPPKGLQYPMAASRGKNLFRRDSNDLQDLPKYYDVVLKANKSVVIPNLSAYRVQHISIDSAVLPEGFDTNATEFDAMPDYKSGYRVKVGGSKKASFRATLLDKSGEPLKLQGGQLVMQGKSKQMPILFFTDNKGEVFIDSISNGKYLIELFSERSINRIKTDADIETHKGKNILNIKNF